MSTHTYAPFGRTAMGMLRLFSGLLVLVVGLAEIETATAETVVDGRNVTSVKVATGSFSMIGPKRWVETSDTGPMFNFEEVRRDKWRVFLVDSSRGVKLRIHLRKKQKRLALIYGNLTISKSSQLR